jgi:hypothetical protein
LWASLFTATGNYSLHFRVGLDISLCFFAVTGAVNHSDVEVIVTTAMD